MRVAPYARFSTDRQNPRSTDDQIFEIRAFVQSRGWTIVEEYADSAVSGSGLKGRHEYQRMKLDARKGKFDCVVAEDLDRLSRRTRDLASFYDIMEFLGIAVWTLADGKISNLQVGLKGTMSAEFLRGVAQKTLRGQAAAVRDGRLAGGKAYGYRPSGRPGEPEIVPEEAEIVRRIFNMRLIGHSPREIAGRLNKEAIPSPQGGQWNASTIHGCARKMTGILRNKLYIGKIVWNKRSYLKDPENEGIVTRLNDKSEHVTADAPHLRIVDQSLWDGVQDAIGPQRKNRSYTRSNGYLLSGIVKCGVCGGSYCSVGGSKWPRFGCSSYRERRSCDNNRLIGVAILDATILSALKKELLNEELVELTAIEISKAYKELCASSSKVKPKLIKRLKEISTGRNGLFRLLEKGVSPSTIQDRLCKLDEEEERIEAQLATLPEPEPLTPEDAAKEYRNCVSNLAAISDPSNRVMKTELVNKVRRLIDCVIVHSKDDPAGRDIELVGDLAILFGDRHTSMTSMVAGAGFEPATFRL